MTRSIRHLHVWVTVAVAAIVLAGSAPSARAEGFLNGYVGVNFGGDMEVNTTVFGGSLGAISTSGIGVEADFGYSPDFYDTEEFLGAKTSVFTLMGNVILGPASRGAGVRPYVTGGLGLMRTSVDVSDLFDNVSRNDFAIDAGGGLFIDFSNGFAMRGDFRYFRSLRDEDGGNGGVLPDLGFDLGDFDFWRATVGATIKF
jgi:hypothetical protein